MKHSKTLTYVLISILVVGVVSKQYRGGEIVVKEEDKRGVVSYVPCSV